MRRIQLDSIVIVAVRLVVTLLFAAAILPKLTNPGVWAHVFTTWGYPAWGPPVISAVEIVGVIALWIPAAAKWASAPLMLTTAGATGTWLINGPKPVAAFPAMVFVLVGVLAWLQSRARMKRDPRARQTEPLAN